MRHLTAILPKPPGSKYLDKLRSERDTLVARRGELANELAPLWAVAEAAAKAQRDARARRELGEVDTKEVDRAERARDKADRAAQEAAERLEAVDEALRLVSTRMSEAEAGVRDHVMDAFRAERRRIMLEAADKAEEAAALQLALYRLEDAARQDGLERRAESAFPALIPTWSNGRFTHVGAVTEWIEAARRRLA